MSTNLRDRGYSSSMSPTVARKPNMDTVMRNTTPVGYFKGSSVTTTREAQPANPAADEMLNGLITAYNSKAFTNPNAPLLHRSGTDYVTNDTDERARLAGIDLRDHNNNRLAFVNRDISPTQTSYYAGVDNLNPILGDGEYNRDIPIPIGNINLAYDGDTASVGLKMDKNNYYLQALARLLGR